MVEKASLVSRRIGPRTQTAGAIGLVLILSVLTLFGCATPLKAEFPETRIPMPRFEVEENRFVSFDGAELGLTVWGEQIEDPEYVIVGVHGMNDYANAFHMAAPWWAENGIRTYAYDQRGFGRSPNRGLWPNEDAMREDLRTAVRTARERHPDAVLGVVGISMGGAVAMTTFGGADAPEIDRLILSGPGLRGWGAIPFYQSIALQISARVRPGWVVVPPKGIVKIEPSDNVEMLRRTWSDPLMQRDNRIDQVFGVVTLMENAHRAASNLPDKTLLLYGARDIVIPEKGVRRTTRHLPGHVRTAYYDKGYHMLMRDLQAENVWRDVLTFMQNPEEDLPSGSPELPWLTTTS